MADVVEVSIPVEAEAASALVGAAIGPDGVSRRAFRRAREIDPFALSAAVRDEIVAVLHRPRLARFVDPALRDELLDLLVPAAVWFEPAVAVSDCRDAKDNGDLEPALASGAGAIVSSDDDLLALHLLARRADSSARRIPGEHVPAAGRDGAVNRSPGQLRNASDAGTERWIRCPDRGIENSMSPLRTLFGTRITGPVA